MNKFWIAVPVVVIVAAIPFIIAPQAEKAYAKGIAELDQSFSSSNIPLKIEQVSYDSGFLSSRAVDLIRLRDMGDKEADPSHCVEFTTELNHGYLDLLNGQWGESKTTLRPPAEQSGCALGELYATDREFVDFYEQSFDANGPIVVSTEYKFSGSAAIQYTINPFEVDQTIESDKVKLSVFRLEGDMHINSARDNVDFDLSWPGLAGTIHDGDEVFQFKVGDYSVSGHQNLAYPNLWVGSVMQTTKDISMQGEGEQKVSLGLNSFTVTSESKIEAAKLNSSTQMTFNGITSANQDLGDLTMTLDFSQFDAEALDRVIGAMNELFASLQPAAAGRSSESYDKEIFLRDLKKIADTGKVQIKSLNYGIGENKAHIDGAFNLANLEAVPMDVVLQNPLMLINHLKINLNAELDEALVRNLVTLVTELSGDFAALDDAAKSETQKQMMMQFTQAAQNFTQMNYLKYDSDKASYKTNLVFENGQALVNNQPFAIPGG